MTEYAFINTKGHSHSITAEVTIPAGTANGVILAQAGRFGGWLLYVKDGRPTDAYNFVGLKRAEIVSSETFGAGRAFAKGNRWTSEPPLL